MVSQRTYQRRIQALRNLLLDIEWVQPTYNGSPSCPLCSSQQHWGHEADCPFVTALGQPQDGPRKEPSQAHGVQGRR